MPVHRGSRTKVHLVSTDLRSTTTAEPSINKVPTVTEHVANVEQKLKDGHVLKERNIPLDGDDNPLHLLGGDEYMPFLFVRAGEDMRPVPATREERVFHPDPTRNAIYARVLGSDPADAIKIPQALALRVELSKQSFLKTDKPVDDIRIDVLFNGQLTHSSMRPKRSYQEQQETLVNIFSGLRSHRVLERAWLLVPPGQDPDGSRRRPVASSDTLADRWKKIQKEVIKEASARGVDKNGNRPMVAKYLMEVAKLAMPPELETWSEPRGQAFGVIDVVLSYGRGIKDVPAKFYLTEPTRMGSSKFKEGEEYKSIFEGISIPPKTDFRDSTSRYNLRAATPENRAASGGAPTIAKIPARPRPGKTSSRTLRVEQSDTLSGPSVEKEGNTIISSEQLPSYLSDEIAKHGYTLRVGSATDGSPNQINGEKTTGGKKDPSKVQDQQPHVSTPSYITNRSSRVIERLDGIPEEEEEEGMPGSSSGDVFTSSGTVSHQGPPGAIKTSSMPLRSSQSSETNKLEIIPLSSSMSGMPSGLPSPRASLLPPVQIHTGVRSRRMADQDEGGSPRKKRRLSGPLSPLDVKKTEGGIGMTHRGVFTVLGSPGDKSQRSMFNSFTLGSRIDLDPAGPRQRPPTSPLSPDLSFRQRQDPVIARLVFKSNEQVIRTIDITHPFRISQLRSIAAAAEARSNKKCLPEDKAPFSKVTSSFPPSMPSTPHQSTLISPTQVVPQTPIPHRTWAGNPSSAGSAPGHPASGGIFNTPNPLPRYSKAPMKSPYSTAAQPQSQTLLETPAARTTRDSTPDSVQPPSSTTIGPASASRRRPDDRRNTHVQMEKDFRAFVAPELSRDCAITYAQPPLPPAGLAHPSSSSSAAGSVGDNGASWREWMEDEPRAFGGGVVRQIRSERAGEFEEEGILVGVRFLVV